jgi:PEP-CTERM motif
MIARRFIAGLFVLLTTLPAVSAPVTFTFAGQLSFVSPALSSAFNIGDSFAGSFTFESVTADMSPLSPNLGEYAPAITFSISVGALSFSSPSPNARITVQNGSPDIYDVHGELTTGNAGFVPSFWEFVIWDFDGTMLNSDALPLTPLPLSLAEIFDLELFFAVPAGIMGGNLSSFELAAAPVPEPETYALVLAGLGILGFVATRRKACSL